MPAATLRKVADVRQSRRGTSAAHVPLAGVESSLVVVVVVVVGDRVDGMLVRQGTSIADIAPSIGARLGFAAVFAGLGLWRFRLGACQRDRRWR